LWGCGGREPEEGTAKEAGTERRESLVATTGQQDEVTRLIEGLRSSDWPTVYRAKWRLECLQGEGIEALLGLLEVRARVLLTETADLIYPGAKEFYGHGWVVDYDLDYIPARAGWALEELTFQDFGFSEGRIKHDELLAAVIEGKRDVALKEVAGERKDILGRERAITQACERAKAWWTRRGKDWSRFSALKETLGSGNVMQQAKTLEWVRYGVSQCDGLDPKSYERELLPLVKKLAKSEDEEVRAQAELLLGDDEGWWWKYKTDPELRKWTEKPR
jgi:hypothetical protein